MDFVGDIAPLCQNCSLSTTNLSKFRSCSPVFQLSHYHFLDIFHDNTAVPDFSRFSWSEVTLQTTFKVLHLITIPKDQQTIFLCFSKKNISITVFKGL